jgi:hypothetical protein
MAKKEGEEDSPVEARVSTAGEGLWLELKICDIPVGPSDDGGLDSDRLDEEKGMVCSGTPIAS